MSELKPCPFCGGVVKLDNNRAFNDYAGNFFENSYSIIECKRCGIAMKVYPKRGYGTTKEQRLALVKKWNSRAQKGGGKKMKITCTEAEKEQLIAILAHGRQCPLAASDHNCDRVMECRECIEQFIEWDIQEGGAQ